MLSNHPHIAAQLAAAHRDDLLRQADSRRLRRLARAAARAERRTPKRAEAPASDVTPHPVTDLDPDPDQGVVRVVEVVEAPAPVSLPAPPR